MQFLEYFDWAKIKYFRLKAAYQAKSTYPDSIELDISDLLGRSRPIKVTIIDDEPFPWIDAIESRGCVVQYHQDYTKPITQQNQKIKSVSTQASDIIMCDINGVGSAIYPGLDGVGVIEELRRKHPLHLIVAYTGNPLAIHTKLKQKNSLDGILSRDWSIDDFLFNFDDLLKIFKSPARRWDFIQTRLRHLGVKEKEISQIREQYVENVLLSKMLKERFQCDANKIQEILISDRTFSLSSLLNVGLTTQQAISIVSPFVFGVD